MKQIAILTFIVLFLSNCSFAQSSTPARPNFFDVREKFLAQHGMLEKEEEKGKELGKEKGKGKEENEEKDGEMEKFGRWEWYWKQRVGKTGEFPPADVLWNEWKKYSANHPEAGFGTEHKKGIRSASRSSHEAELPTTSASWSFYGPTSSTSNYQGVGRVNCIAFHPTDSNIFWVGTPGGGLWKTTDGGSTWTTNTDNLPVLGVSDVIINPSNPSVMYMATGDADGVSSISQGDTKSVGVLKSTDGGSTWNTTGLTWTLSNQLLIRKLAMDATNPGVILAAATNGIYRSTDSGATWTKTESGLFMDIVFHPTNHNIVYAAYSSFSSSTSSAVLRSTDNGVTWTVTYLTNSTRIKLAVTPAEPKRVEALCVDSTWGLLGIWKSLDSGATFTEYVTGSSTNNYLSSEIDGSGTSGQGFYDVCMVISPTDSNKKFVGGVNTWGSTNGGSTWSIKNFWSDNSLSVPVVHADKHLLVYRPIVSNCLIECNDGGIYKTYNNGASWINLTNGLGNSEIYRISSSATDTANVLCGLQDNGSKELLSGSWNNRVGGDGMNCIIDYTTSNTQYAAYVKGEIYQTTDDWASVMNTIASSGGTAGTVNEDGNWLTPYIMHPTNHNTLLVGKTQVYQTTDAGTTWTTLGSISGASGEINAMAYAPSNTSVIYVAYDYQLYKTTNGGTTWSAVESTSDVITDIVVNPSNANQVWITTSGYDSSNKVFASADGGSTWTNISGSLPNIPVNTIVYQNNSYPGLYIGTDLGVYFYCLTCTGADWVSYNAGLPNVVVDDLEISAADSKLWAGTYGRGLWKTRLITPIIVDSITGPTTVCVGATATLSDSTSGGRWHSSNTSVVTVDSISGVMTGISGGIVTISYMASGAMATLNVASIATIGPITGPANVYVGQTITLSETSTGGSWSASNANVSDLGTKVTGLSAGVSVISYSVTGICSITPATKTITVLPVPPGGTRWYGYDDYLNTTWGSSNTWYTTMDLWNDTTAVFGYSGSGYFMNYWTSIGMSFDPFAPGFNDSTYYPHTVSVHTTDSYIIDSVKVVGAYYRNYSTPAKIAVRDTLRLAFVYGNGGATTDLPYYYFNDAGSTSYFPYTDYSVDTLYYLQMMHDSLRNMAGINDSGVTPVVRDIILSGTDTASEFDRAFPVYVTVPSGNFAAVSVTFISGDTHPVGDTVRRTAGTWKYNEFSPYLAYEGTSSGTAVFPAYHFNDQNQGYFKQEGSGDAGWAGSYVPQWAWTSAASASELQYPDVYFHVVCGTCALTSGNTVSFIDGHSQTMAVCNTGSADSINSLLSVTDIVSGQSLIWSAITVPVHGTLTASHTATSTGSAITPHGLSYTPTLGYTGTDSFKVRITNGTKSDTTKIVVTVTTLPIVAGITSAAFVCTGSTITVTDTTTGGAWSVLNSNVSLSGTSLTGMTAGVDTIYYSKTNSCGTTTASRAVSVNVMPAAGTITGAGFACIGVTDTLLDSVATTGTWSVTDTNISITGYSGGCVIHAHGTGMDTIKYAFTNVCGTAAASKIVNVYQVPYVGAISGDSTICAGSTTTFTDSYARGAWSSGSASLTIDSVSGFASASSAGTATISYSWANVCGSSAASKIVTVLPLASAGTILGSGVVCVGAHDTLMSTSTSGSWAVSNASATVSPSGVVTGVYADTVLVRYTVTNTCNTATATFPVTVHALAAVSAFTLPSNLCSGSTYTVTDSISGGVWHVTNSHATISAGGILTGAGAGIDTVVYTMTNICNTASYSLSVDIIALPHASVVTGNTFDCIGSPDTLSDSTSGGMWRSANSRGIISGNVLLGNATGMDTVYYRVSNVCGADSAMKVINIGTIPNPGTISGTDSICVSATATMSDAATGGTWSVTNGNLSINSIGVVHAISPGMDTVKYSLSNSCGSADTTHVVTILELPARPTLTGSDISCIGIADSFTTSSTGGMWFLVNGNALLTGNVVTGVTAGPDTICYKVSNYCGIVTDSMAITVFTVHQCDSILSVGAMNGAIPGLKVFPNPTTGVFTVQTDDLQPIHAVTVMDVCGRVISEVCCEDKAEMQIDLSNYPRGTYLLKVLSGNIVDRVKVVVY